MTRQILAILFTLISIQTFAQDCEVQKDPFSNKQVVSYKFGKYIVFELKDNEILLKYHFQFDGEMNATMQKGSAISFKFENDEMVELSALEDVNPISQVGGYVSFALVTTEYIVTMKVTADQLKTFANFKMTHVRYPDLKGDFITKDRSKRWVKAFSEGAQCIQSNLSK